MDVKIPFYNVVNMLLTGLILIGCCILLFPHCILILLSNELIPHLNITSEVVIVISIIAISYEIGLIINRIGSIVIEPFLKITKLIPFENDYAKFNESKLKYPILSTLSREYALSRTNISLYLLLLILSIASKHWGFSVVFFLLILLFFFSCRKHAKKMVTLIRR